MSPSFSHAFNFSCFIFVCPFLLLFGLHSSCHCQGCLIRLLLDSFLYFAKSNSSHPLVDLIFPLILSIHVTSILSYPSLHDHYLTSIILLSNALVYFMTSYKQKETAIYSYKGGWSSSANSKAIWVPTNSSGSTWTSSSMGTS